MSKAANVASNHDVEKATESKDSKGTEIVEKKIIFNENTPQARFNQGLLWPPVIKLPENEWLFSLNELLENVNSTKDAKKVRSFIKYCIEFLYNCKKDLNLQDHTFTCMSTFFYRYWMLEGSEKLLSLGMEALSQVLLVIVITSCKTMENHRKVNQYVEVVVARSNPTIKSMTVLDKKKWVLRENLLNNEMMFLAKLKFDLNVVNAKTVLDDFYGFYAKYNVDNKDSVMKNDTRFKTQFSSLIKDCKQYITNSMTQPISLICDGYDFVQYSLVFCAFNLNKMHKLAPSDENYFKFTEYFFGRKFRKVLSVKKICYLAQCQYILEQNFLNNKTNKGAFLLEMTEDVVRSLIDETDLEAGTESETTLVEKRHVQDAPEADSVKRQKVESNGSTEKKENPKSENDSLDKTEQSAEQESLNKTEKNAEQESLNKTEQNAEQESPYDRVLNTIDKSNLKFRSLPVENSNYYVEKIVDDVSADYLTFIENRISASYKQDAKMQQQQQAMK